MEKGLYGFIWRYSKGYQLVILCVTIASFPLLYYALELPKIIVNDALGSKPGAEPFPREYLGFQFDQMEYLLALCGLFLLVLLINGGTTTAGPDEILVYSRLQTRPRLRSGNRSLYATGRLHIRPCRREA